MYVCMLHMHDIVHIYVHRNGIVDKEDASGMVEKVTEKWPQPEDRALLIQQQMQAAEKRKVGTARGREKEVPIEELARAKTSGEEEVLLTGRLT